MNPIYKKYTTMVALFWVACLLVLLVAYVLALKPQRQVRRDIEDKLAMQKEMLEGALEASNPQTKERFAREVQEYRAKLRDFVTDSDGAANMTFDISRIANEEKVSAFSIKMIGGAQLDSVAQCEYIGENRMEVSFEGNFNQFARFVNALERHRPVVFVDSFSIGRSNFGTGGNHITMSLSVFVEKKQDV